MISRLYKTKLFVLLALLISGAMMVSCNDDDEDNASDEIILLSYGPSPILRGEQIQFIGRNLDQVTTIVFPENVEVTEFEEQQHDKIVVVVPEAAVPGNITLKTPDGDIVPKTPFDVLEPIEIENISPLELRPGAVLTIKGTYLNLINQVQFSVSKVVKKADFVSQSQTELKVTVPADAQSGPIIISNLAENENELVEIESEEEIAVILPKITGMSPLPVKPGNNLTITGTDLDLTAQVLFNGGVSADEFVSVSATELVVVVPLNSLEGVVKVSAPSLVSTESADPLTIVAPTISDISPSPIKSGNNVTITGTDLDLVTDAVFGGGVEGTIVTQSETQLEITVPQNASEDVVTLNTVAKSVSSAAALELVDPTITSLSETTIKTNQELTITGTDLDLVVSVFFGGGIQGTISSQTETELVVKVPVGSESDVITLNTINNSEILSSESITILPGNVPVISTMPLSAKRGSVLVVEGEKMEFVVEVIFPGDIVATKYGAKTATLLEVYVPENTTKGKGTITLITYEDEVTTTPEILITGLDPVQDTDLVFFNFDGTGAKDSWWGAVSIESDASHEVNGTPYGRINGSYTNWSDLFWRNASNNFPGDVVGTDISSYVLKFDIKLVSTITDGNLKFKLQPDGGTEYWALIGPEGPSGENVLATDGWITMTIPLTDFKDGWGWGTNTMTDLSGGSTTFGMAFDNGSADLDFYIDNVRFELKE